MKVPKSRRLESLRLRSQLSPQDPRRESSLPNGDLGLVYLSMFRQCFLLEDIWTLSERTSSSRLQTVSTPKCGNLNGRRRRSFLNPPTTNLGTSRTQVHQVTCNSGIPMVVGGRGSDIKTSNSSTRKARYLTFQVEPIRKDRTYSYGTATVALVRNGR